MQARDFIDLSRPERRRVLLLAVAGLLVYLPVFFGQWLWNDAALASTATLGEVWSRPESAHTLLGSTVQWALRGLVASSAFDFHIAMWLLHMAAAFLLWRVFEKLEIRWAFFGALLFTVHPLAVETVAWIPDLGNVLALPLMLGSFLLFLRGKPWSAALYLLAVLSSDAVLMFPAALVLYLWWKKGRLKREDWMRCAPFLTIGLVAAVGISWLASGLESSAPGWGAIIAAFVARPIFLLGKVVWPFDLAPIYPGWFVSYLGLLLAAAAPAGVLFWSWRKRAGWGRPVCFGLGYFLLMAVPFCPQLAWVSNQQAYVPMIGLIGLVAGGAGDLHEWLTGKWRQAVVVAMSAILLLLGVLAFGNAMIFTSEKSLWAYALEKNPDSWIAHNRSAKTALAEERTEDALFHLSEAVRRRPEMAELHFNYAIVLEQAGQYAAAASEYDRAARLAPEEKDYASVSARMLVRIGRYHEAVYAYDQLLEARPDNADYLCNRGVALYHLGRYDEAIRSFEKALTIDPSMRDAADNLKLAIRHKSDPPEANLSPGQAPANLSNFEKPILLFPPNKPR